MLAPIVDRPEDSRVPDETREELRRLARRYALVACVSGRTGDDARRIVGLDELVYVGEHGLELDPEAPKWRERIRAFADDVAWPVEDKGLSLSFHYRTAEDPEAAEAYLLEAAERALDEIEWGIRVGVVSDEGPRGIADAADGVVHSPAELLDLLRTL